MSYKDWYKSHVYEYKEAPLVTLELCELLCDSVAQCSLHKPLEKNVNIFFSYVLTGEVAINTL